MAIKSRYKEINTKQPIYSNSSKMTIKISENFQHVAVPYRSVHEVRERERDLPGVHRYEIRTSAS